MVPTILTVIELIAATAPKLIAAGLSVYDIWKSADAIIRDSQSRNGRIDMTAYAVLVNKCDEADAVIQKRAKEASE